jgi:MFS family permease
MSEKRSLSLKTIYLTWFLLAVFYAYQYFLRVTPSIMVSDICSAFSLNAEQFSLIPAVYLYAYGLLQIPLGFILDSVGIKKTVIASAIISILGTCLFFTTTDINLAYLARFLIGLGAAATFIAPLKLAGDHLPPGQRGLLIGLTLTIGTLGALLAGRPQSMFLQCCGWRELGLWSVVIGLVLFVLMLIFIPKSSVIDIPQKQSYNVKSIINSIKVILKNKAMLIYGTLAFGLYSPLTVLSETWGVSYLMEKYHFDMTTAAGCMSFIFIGLCLGSFMVPAYFEKNRRINRGILICITAMCLAFSTFLYFPGLNLFWIKTTLFLFGFFSGAEMLCFTGIAHVSTEGSRGLAFGVANTINMIGGAILQQLTGKLLDTFWSGKTNAAGLRIYGVDDYTQTLCFFIVIFVVCVVVAGFLLKAKDE